VFCSLCEKDTTKMAVRSAAADVAEKWRQHDKKLCVLELKKKTWWPQRVHGIQQKYSVCELNVVRDFFMMKKGNISWVKLWGRLSLLNTGFLAVRTLSAYIYTYIAVDLQVCQNDGRIWKRSWHTNTQSMQSIQYSVKKYCKYFICSVMVHLHTYKFNLTVQAVCI